MRNTFADALVSLRSAQQKIFVLDGDCARSTNNNKFNKIYPQSFLNIGIAEQNMVGIAAGFALNGYIPIVCSFAAMLVARAAEQILQSVAYMNLNVKIIGHYAGMSAALEGAPHHAICDLAFMRAVPNMSIWIPSDDSDVFFLTNKIVEHQGPSYLRLCRNPTPPLIGGELSSDQAFKYWKNSNEILLVTAGPLTTEAISSAKELENSLGLKCSVLALLQIKPVSTLLSVILSKYKFIFSIDEHSIVGGIGSLVAEIISEMKTNIKPAFARIGINDCFTQTGTYQDLLDYYGLTAKRIVTKIQSFINLNTDLK